MNDSGVLLVLVAVVVAVGALVAVAVRRRAPSFPEPQGLLRPGAVRGRRFSTAEPPATVTSVDGSTVDDAVAAFADTAGWVLTSEGARADPRLVRAELPSLDLMSAGMVRVIEPGAEAVVDFTPGAYTTYGHSGDAAAPAMVMLDALVVVTVDGSSRWLKIGGVMVRTTAGWTPSTMQSTELPQPDDLSTPLVKMAPAQAQRVMGDTSLGWKSFAAAGR